MTLSAAITFGISIASFIGTIIWKCVDLSLKMGKLSQRFDSNEERDKEERNKNSVNFEEIFTRLKIAENDVVKLYANVGSLTETCARIESKLDRLIEKGI